MICAHTHMRGAIPCRESYRLATVDEHHQAQERAVPTYLRGENEDLDAGSKQLVTGKKSNARLAERAEETHLFFLRIERGPI